MLTVDSTSIGSDSLFVKAVETVPLSSEEEKAYSTLDSTATLEKAFKPSGFLSRFIDDEENNGGGGEGFLSQIPGSLSPALRYNRVDELHAGLKYSIEITDGLDLDVNGGYSTGYKEWGYGAGIEYEFLNTDRFDQSAGVEYSATTATQYQSAIYGAYFTSVTNLLGEPDYYNYYRNEGYRIFSDLEFNDVDLSATIAFNSEEHTALSQQTSYDILGRDQAPQLNPEIEEGMLRSVDIKTGYNLNEDYNFGVTGLRRIGVMVEYSGDALGSDFNFTRLGAHINWSLPTFYQRRLLSNTLDLKLGSRYVQRHPAAPKNGNYRCCRRSF
ncbi:MAG: hypothetical protein U5K69_27880 [Balneolaceae bacterium]|nr:hypothetical protein [Balneolaceae bacterium]